MTVSRFLKPKWQRANPEARRQAVNSLTDQAILSQVCRSDPDPAIRRLACRKLQNLEVLSLVAESDGDAGVREFAAARQRRLVCALESESLPLETRLSQLTGDSPVRLLEQAAARGREPALRLKAVQFVDDADILAEIAARDDSAPVRSAAAERLTDKDALERVLRKARKKDKKVYRIIRTKLKEVAEREQAPARIRDQCETICERLERLGRRQTWGQDRALLDHLDEQWQALEPQAEAQLLDRYRRARQRFLDAYQAYRAGSLLRVEEEKRADLRQRRQALLEELEAALASNSETSLQEALERIPAQWEGLARTSEPDEDEARLATDYAESMKKVRGSLAQFEQRHTRISELAGEIADLLSGGAILQVRAMEAVEREAGEILQGIGPDEAAQSLRQGLGRLVEAMQKQRRKALDRQDRLDGLAAELEQALEGGVLKKATSLYSRLEADVELIEASGLPDAQIHNAKQVLRALVPRLRELQNWRKWGTDLNRESLCRSMEELVDADLEPGLLAQRLRELQTDWKGLDRSGSPGNRALWDRFHGASDRVFARCGPYLEEQARQRETNRSQREALCADLEAFLEKIDWETVDWKKAVRAEREMRNAWSALGPVDPKTRRALDKRFRQALRTLNKQLAEERGRNQAHKRRLIDEARALMEESDLEKAVREVKNLQRQWHTSVAGKRGHENRIWQEFRAACDQVFARRQAQDELHREELRANLKVRQDICEALEVLVQSANPGVRELQHDFQALEGRWSAAAELQIPHSAAQGLLRRWEEGLRRYRDRVREFGRLKDREQLELLHRRAVLCEELEGYLEHPEDARPVLQDIQTRWQSLPALGDPAVQEQIDRRYLTAHRALVEQGARLEAQLKGMALNQERRESLCLHMEVLAGMESPPEEAQQRLALQVERLSEHMQQGEGDVHRGAMRLEKEWYLTGPPGEETKASLERRFLRALQAMTDDPADAAAPGALARPESGGSPPGGLLRSKRHRSHHAPQYTGTPP